MGGCSILSQSGGYSRSSAYGRVGPFPRLVLGCCPCWFAFLLLYFLFFFLDHVENSGCLKVLIEKVYAHAYLCRWL